MIRGGGESRLVADHRQSGGTGVSEVGIVVRVGCEQIHQDRGIRRVPVPAQSERRQELNLRILVLHAADEGVEAPPRLAEGSLRQIAGDAECLSAEVTIELCERVKLADRLSGSADSGAPGPGGVTAFQRLRGGLGGFEQLRRE